MESKIKKIQKNGITYAIIEDDQVIIKNLQDALDLLIISKYKILTNKIIINKDALTQDFFNLETGLAGEILQKYTNYGVITCIYGDYSNYTSKSLKDFIYETNKGKSTFFSSTKEEAFQILSKIF